MPISDKDRAGDSERTRRDGSALCLECGLCCHGVLHHYGALREEEVEAVSGLGLMVERTPDYLSFVLPCPKIDGARCTIYAQRPSTCSDYRCGLLNRYREGELELAEALPLIAQARDLKAKADEVLPAGKSFRDIRWQWRHLLWGTGDAEMDVGQRTAIGHTFLRIMMLDRFLDKHFRQRHEKTFMGPEHSPSDAVGSHRQA